MAKKKEKHGNKASKEGNVKHNISALLVVLLIIFIWLILFVVLIRLDVGGFGSSILRPLVKDIPVINAILPEASDEQLAYENNYPYQTIEDAADRINELEKQNASLKKKNDKDSDKIKELQSEIARLKVFEDNQVAFEKRVKDFETNVVLGDKAPDIAEYKKYYEEINPTNAETIYRQVVEQTLISDAIKQKAEIYKDMDPGAAAAIFETMTADTDLLAQMLLSMKSNESAQILAEMDSTAAAKITKKMFDIDQENQKGY